MSELVEIAILAYRNGRYSEAVELLEQAIVHNSKNWIARLYLSMSYQKLNRMADAYRHLDTIVLECDDPVVREKAQQTLQLLESMSQRPRHKKDKPDQPGMSKKQS